MRRQGIHFKEVFFARRVRDSVDGNYFTYNVKKKICNPKDEVKYYLKIGGIVFAEKKKVKGKKICSCAERFKDFNTFGSFVFYCENDTKLRTITYCRRNGLPEKKLVSGIGVLNSVIPRSDGKSETMITGIKINSDSESYDRSWTRFDGLLAGKEHKGFFELVENFDYNQYIGVSELNPNRKSFVGIYITENTSLLMVDETKEHLFNDLIRGRVYTLFQEGALIICEETDFLFKFYDVEESESLTQNQMYSKQKFMPSTRNMDHLFGENPIIFLKPDGCYAMWTLRVTAIRSDTRRRKTILGIPTDGQFEEVFNCKDGIEEVIKRQALKPWKKYVEIFGQPENDNKFTSIDLRITEAYPKSHRNNL
jgi:hypothetical protein